MEGGRGPSGLLRWSGHRSRRVAHFGCETWKWAAVPVGNRCPGIAWGCPERPKCYIVHVVRRPIVPSCGLNLAILADAVVRSESPSEVSMWCACKSDVITGAIAPLSSPLCLPSCTLPPLPTETSAATLSHVGLGLTLAWAPGKRSEITVFSLAGQH